MSAHFNFDFSRCSQSVKRPSDECSCHGSFPYVDASRGFEFVSVPAKVRSYVATAGDTIVVPISRPGECLPPISVFRYFD